MTKHLLNKIFLQRIMLFVIAMIVLLVAESRWRTPEAAKPVLHRLP